MTDEALERPVVSAAVTIAMTEGDDMENLYRDQDKEQKSDKELEDGVPVESDVQDSELQPENVRLRGVVPKDAVPHTGVL